MRPAGSLRRHPADATGSAVDLVADGRADPIRQAVRGGAHRQSASGDIPRRDHVGDERRRHPPTDLEHRAGQLYEQQREPQQPPDAGEHRQPEPANRSDARHDPEGSHAEPGLQILQARAQSRARDQLLTSPGGSAHRWLANDDLLKNCSIAQLIEQRVLC